MPISALFLLMMGVGGYLVYAAVKDEHPWQEFTTVLGKSSAPPSATLQPSGGTNTAVTGTGAFVNNAAAGAPITVGGGDKAA